MGSDRFKKGDPVVFTKTKSSTRPGPRAEAIAPAGHGDSYSYLVRKFWTVIDNADNRLLVRTRTGKQHWVHVDDPALRAPTWWEQFKYRERFPSVSDGPSERGGRNGEAANQR